MAVNRWLHGSPYLKTLQDADAYPDSARTDATQSSSGQTSKYKAIIFNMFLLESKANALCIVARTTFIHR